MRQITVFAVYLLSSVVLAAAEPSEGQRETGTEILRAGEKKLIPGKVVFEERFDSAEPAVWVEGSRDRVEVEEGRMIMDSNDPEDLVLTVFVDRWFEGDLYFEYEAEILASDTAAVLPEPRDANNINTFLYYADPAGRDLKETRGERADAAYKRYHELNGYIVTFINGYILEVREKMRNPEHVIALEKNTARIRLRENPGFTLTNESFAEESVSGRVYRMQFVFAEGELYFFIDGKFQLSFRPSPEKRVDEGYFAFRTYATEMAVDNFVAREVSVEAD